MRYYFHVVFGGGSDIGDQNGGEFSSDQDAMAHAAVIARELREEAELVEHSILVMDEGKREVGRVPVGSGPPSHG